jgi:methylenetetrahydrofolate--tRNA-(uracil-5-)-methyltransferase
MLGGLYRYLRDANPNHFQPMNANFGLLDPLPGRVKKDRKKELLVERAQRDFRSWMDTEVIASNPRLCGDPANSLSGSAIASGASRPPDD